MRSLDRDERRPARPSVARPRNTVAIPPDGDLEEQLVAPRLAERRGWRSPGAARRALRDEGRGHRLHLNRSTSAALRRARRRDFVGVPVAPMRPRTTPPGSPCSDPDRRRFPSRALARRRLRRRPGVRTPAPLAAACAAALSHARSGGRLTRERHALLQPPGCSRRTTSDDHDADARRRRRPPGHEAAELVTTLVRRATCPRRALARGPHQSEPGRSVKDIQVIVQAHRDDARACYDQAQQAHPDPTMKGNLDVKWTIDPTGKVTEISVDDSRSDIHDPRDRQMRDGRSSRGSTSRSARRASRRARTTRSTSTRTTLRPRAPPQSPN